MSELAAAAMVERVLDAHGPEFTEQERDALYAIGRIYYGREDYVRALDVLRLLVLAAPLDARSWFSLGACHESRGELDVAERFYRIAMDAPERDLERSLGALHLAALAARDRRDDEAREALERVDASLLEPEQVAFYRALHARIRGGRS